MFLNLNQFRIFYVAAREGSFARAAELLSITPQAVTHAIDGLESHHKIGFFQKAGRGVKLTQEGEILYEQARSVFEAADKLEQALEDLGRVGPYELRVGAGKMAARSLSDLHEICTKRFISLQISAFACIRLPVLICMEGLQKGLILQCF